VEPPSVIVEIRLTTEPTHTQQVAWIRLWGRILAPEGHRPTPAEPAGTELEGTYGPDAPIREVIDGRSGQYTAEPPPQTCRDLAPRPGRPR
jgi:hypothetical protein